MFFKLSVFIIALFFSGCMSTDTKQSKLDGKKLLEQKCASCHNINLPPKNFENEVAPPMMAVSFHVVNFVKTNGESQRVTKAREFVNDYVMNPSESKSFCDEKSLKTYGLMPSLKGKLSLDELDAISKYMFKHFTQANLSEAQRIENTFNAMPKGKRLALKNNCLTCHKIDKNLVGPPFNEIALRYKNDIESIKVGIKEGSVKKYKESRGAVMPAFKNINDEDLQTISKWILQTKK